MKNILIILLISFFLYQNSFADTVTLNNNQSIEGIIEEENESSIVLNVGCGTITLLRTDIKSIKKSDEAANKSMMQGWKEEYFVDFPAPTPEEQEILHAFKELRVEKGKLARKIALRDNISKEVNMLQEGLSRLQKERDNAGMALKGIDSDRSPAKYNDYVTEFNSLNIRLGRVVNTLNNLQEEKSEINEMIVGVINKLSEFRQMFEERHRMLARRDITAEQENFYASLRKNLDELEKDIERREVRFTEQGGGVIVTVTLNNKTEAKMLIDTGASLTTISEQVFSRLGIDPANLEQEIELVLADGSKASAHFLLLNSVKVGDVEARGVGAAVISQRPGPGVDGLLGMSFLSNFSFHLDSESQKIIFRSFE